MSLLTGPAAVHGKHAEVKPHSIQFSLQTLSFGPLHSSCQGETMGESWLRLTVDSIG